MQDIDKAYLGGFFDADGCMALEKQKNGFSLRIKISQSNLEWCNWLLSYHPELKLEDDNRKNKVNFQLRVAGKKAIPLINLLLEHTIIKYPQLVVAKEYLSLIGLVGKQKEREKYHNILRNFKTFEETSRTDDKPYYRMNKYYIAGFLDGDGCVYVCKRFQSHITFTQKTNIHILTKIAEYYNIFSKVAVKSNDQTGTLRVNVDKFKLVLEDLMSICKYKLPQLQEIYNNCNSKGKVQQNIQETYETVKEMKHVDIVKTDTITHNKILTKEEHITYLNRCIDYIAKNFSYDDLIHIIKEKQIKNIRMVKSRDNKIFNLVDWNTFKIKPELIFCESRSDNELWSYYRNLVSNLPMDIVPNARQVRILVKDQISRQYIGLIRLTDVVYCMPLRDKYLNWSDDVKKHNIKYLMDLSCCIPLQPFGYNTCGGKLLTMLAFSQEVSDYIYEKYKTQLVCITTTSINGKSVQYKDNLHYLGNTKGLGTVHVPSELFDEIKNFDIKWLKYQGKKKSKLIVIRRVLSHIKSDESILYHGHERGVYIKYTSDIELDAPVQFPMNQLESVSEIYNRWYNTYVRKRIKSLNDRNIISYDKRLYNHDYYDTNPSKSLCLPKFTKHITDDIIMKVLSLKNTKLSLEKIAEKVTLEFNINVTKQDVYNIYHGKLQPEKESDVYKQYMNIKKLRSSSNRSLTDDHIYIIKDKIKAGGKYSDIKEWFHKVYNIKINDQIISRIKTGQLTPIC